MERETAHIRLAIEVESDPISGSVSNGTHRGQRFSGWIELVAAIEAARSPRGGGAAGQTPTKTLGSVPGAKASEL